MRKFIITAEMRDLEQQVHKGEISYSRMIEILCEKADEYCEMKLKNTEIPLCNCDKWHDRNEEEINFCSTCEKRIK